MALGNNDKAAIEPRQRLDKIEWMMNDQICGITDQCGMDVSIVVCSSMTAFLCLHFSPAFKMVHLSSRS